MEKYRMALLRREFPFIDRLMDDLQLQPEEVTDIKVKRGDKSLLKKKGDEESYSWSRGGHCDYTKYFVVLTDGGEERISELKSAGSSSTGSGESCQWEADTVGEQLLTKHIVPDYIVECVKNDTDNNGNGEVTLFWTIYKMKRFDLVGYHHQQIDKAAAALKAEIAAVCDK